MDIAWIGGRIGAATEERLKVACSAAGCARLCVWFRKTDGLIHDLHIPIGSNIAFYTALMYMGSNTAFYTDRDRQQLCHEAGLCCFNKDAVFSDDPSHTSSKPQAFQV